MLSRGETTSLLVLLGGGGGGGEGYFRRTVSLVTMAWKEGGYKFLRCGTLHWKIMTVKLYKAFRPLHFDFVRPFRPTVSCYLNQNCKKDKIANKSRICK